MVLGVVAINKRGTGRFVRRFELAREKRRVPGCAVADRRHKGGAQILEAEPQRWFLVKKKCAESVPLAEQNSAWPRLYPCSGLRAGAAARLL